MKPSVKFSRLGLIILTCISTILILSATVDSMNHQDKDLSLSRVQKMSGKYVFINSEPINEYEVAFEIKGFTLGHFDTPDEISNFVVKNALKISGKDHKDFDGVIIGSGKVDIAIKFK
ncbi:MAG TPA: hypothetical protein VK179_10845 [Bacteroidales bacterium]|nr:hypothetical protein [Bacteroidales bacterium]